MASTSHLQMQLRGNNSNEKVAQQHIEVTIFVMLSNTTHSLHIALQK